MDWPQIAARQGGVVARHQLGRPDASIARMTQRGELRPVALGVFLVRGAPLTTQAQIWAGHLWSGGGVLGFASAAHLWGVIDTAPTQVHLCVDHPSRSRAPDWIRLHRVKLTRTCLTRAEGLPSTDLASTVLDYVGSLRSASAASTLLDRAFQRGWVTLYDLERRLVVSPGRAGNRRLRELKPHFADGAAARSERVLHGILRGEGITGWHPNWPVWSAGRLIAVVDVAFPELRLAIEVDGFAFHSDPARFQRDRTRQNELVSLGWTVLRFTWSDVTQRPSHVGQVVRAAVQT